jgi:hypothetical protein
MSEQDPTRPRGCDPAAPAAERLPAEVAAAIDAIKPREKALLRALEDAETRTRFLEAPHAVLRKLKLPVPAALQHFLRRGNANRPEDFQARPVVLPNGQILTPRVRVRITGESEEG